MNEESNYKSGLNYKYDLFVSYSKTDRSWVKGYLLPALGLNSDRIITRDDFEIGVPVVHEFARAVSTSQYTLLVLSPDYLADQWSDFSDQLASYSGVAENRARLIPLLLHNCKLPLHLDFLVQLDCTEETQWAGEVERLRSLLNQPEPRVERIICPYPGMIPFTSKDARFFYGRETEINHLLRLLREKNLLFVIGPSGSGKSSLVSAGLLSRLDENDYFSKDYWLIKEMRPGVRPSENVNKLLNYNNENWEIHINSLLESTPGARRLLLVIDQFEELFTQTQEIERRQFIATLKNLHQIENCTLLIVMRADFYSDLMRSDLWLISRQNRIEITPLQESELKNAVKKPAIELGIYIEDILLDRLVRDAADEPGALPLMQETMVQLWSMRQRRFLPLSAYERLGSGNESGLAMAIAKKAESSIAEFPSEKQKIVRRVFLRLIQFGEGRADTRRQQPLQNLLSEDDKETELNQVLESLTRNRLLTQSSEEGEERYVDISHESLIRGWPTLRQWIDERREAEQVRRRLEMKAAEWMRLRDKEGGLLDLAELLEAEQWMQSADADDLGSSKELRTLVATSRQRIDKEAHDKKLAQQKELEQANALIEEQRKRAEDNALTAKKLKHRAIILAGAFLVSVVAAFFAFYQVKVASARRMAALALSIMNTGYDRALLMSSQAYNEHKDSETLGSLLVTMQRNPRLIKYLSRQNSMTWVIAFSPNGKILATGHDDGSIQLWNADAFEPIGEPLKFHTKSVKGISFSPDSKIFASCSEDKTVILWDVASRRPLSAPLTGHEKEIEGVSFSPDGKTLATGSQDKKIILWDVASQSQLGQPLEGHSNKIWCVKFSPDGKILASGSEDDTIILWDVVTRKIVNTLTEHQNTVYDLDFSPDGSMLVSGSADKLAILWNVNTGKSLGSYFDGHTGSVMSVSFSGDGKFVATASSDNNIKLWNVYTHSLEDTLTGHSVSINSVVFSPDGKKLLSGGWDNNILLWDAYNEHRLRQTIAETKFIMDNVAVNSDDDILVGDRAGNVVQKEAEKVSVSNVFNDHQLKTLPLSIDFSPDGKTFAVGNTDNTINLWDFETRRIKGSFQGHDNNVKSIAFSPDGNTLISGSDDGTIRLWNVAEIKPKGEALHGHTGSVNSIAFNPNGKNFASAGDDGTIIIWNAETLIPEDKRLIGHDMSITQIIFSPDGKLLASGSGDNKVVLWDVEQRKEIATVQEDEEYSLTSMAVAFSPNGKKLAFVNENNNVIIWDVAAKKALDEPLKFTGLEIRELTFSNDGNILLLGGNDKNPAIWNIKEKRRLDSPSGGDNSVINSIASNPLSNVIAFGSTDGTILLWSLDTNALVTSPLGDKNFVNTVAFNSKGQQTAMGCEDGTVILSSFGGSSSNLTLKGHNGGVSKVAFNPDGTILASGGKDHSIILWNTSTGEIIGQPLIEQSQAIKSLAFSPNGKILASGSEDSSIILWDVSTLKRIGEPLLRHENSVNSLVFSPDGKVLASGSRDRTIILWNVESRNPIGQPLRGHNDTINALTFSKDGKYLASGGYRAIFIWNLDTNESIGTFITPPDTVYALAFNSDGKTLYSAGSKGKLFSWNTDPNSWLILADKIANRSLTEREINN